MPSSAFCADCAGQHVESAGDILTTPLPCVCWCCEETAWKEFFADFLDGQRAARRLLVLEAFTHQLLTQPTGTVADEGGA